MKTEKGEREIGVKKQGTIRVRLSSQGRGDIEFTVNCIGDAGDASDSATIERDAR
jgi:hypothetical protein